MFSWLHNFIVVMKVFFYPSYLNDFLVQIESFLDFSWAAVKILLPSIICFDIFHCHTCGGSWVVASAAVWENMIL